MIRLPDKSKCKRKDFLRSLVIGNFIYLEFMNQKRFSAWDFGSLADRCRNMTTRPKILKVTAKNTMSLEYLINEDGDWKTWVEDKDVDNHWRNNMFDINRQPVYSAHNIWSWFQRDEIRYIKSMTRNELVEKYLMELL